jgi:hypothetical protein
MAGLSRRGACPRSLATRWRRWRGGWPSARSRSTPPQACRAGRADRWRSGGRWSGCESWRRRRAEAREDADAKGRSSACRRRRPSAWERDVGGQRRRSEGLGRGGPRAAGAPAGPWNEPRSARRDAERRGAALFQRRSRARHFVAPFFAHRSLARGASAPLVPRRSGRSEGCERLGATPSPRPKALRTPRPPPKPRPEQRRCGRAASSAAAPARRGRAIGNGPVLPEALPRGEPVPWRLRCRPVRPLVPAPSGG